MATQIGSLVINMAADVASLRRDMDQAKATVAGASASMVSSAKAIGVAFAGIAVAGSFARMIGETINLADSLDELSQKSGFAVEELSKLRAVPDLANVGIEELSKGLKDFNKSLVEATDTSSKSAQIFRALGVDLSGGPQEALLGTAEAFKRLDDATLRSVAASELFGKAGQTFIPALLGGRKAFEDAAREAERFGTVISTQMAKQAGEFNDNLSRLTSSASALGIAIANPLLPALNRMAEALLILRGGGAEAKSVLDDMSEAAGRLIAKLSVFRGGGPAFEALANIASAAGRSIGQTPGNVATGLIGRPEATASGPDAAALRTALTTGTPAPRAAAAARSRFTEIDIQTRALLDGLGPDDDTGIQMDERRRGVEEFERDRVRIIEDANRDIMRSNAEFYDALTRMREEDDERLKDSIIGQIRERKRLDEQAIRDAQQLTRDLGLTFVSAFEDAIAGGKGLRDILAGLEKDIIRIISRESITKPLLGAVSGLFGGQGATLDVGKLFGDGSPLKDFASSAGSWLSSLLPFAEGGFIPPGQWGMTGERGPEPVFGGNTGVTVVPNGGGAMNIVMNISTPDANSFRQSESQILARLSRASSAGRRNL